MEKLRAEPVFSWTYSSDEIFPENLLVHRIGDNIRLSVQGRAAIYPDGFAEPGPVANIMLPTQVLSKFIEALQKLEAKDDTAEPGHL